MPATVADGEGRTWRYTYGAFDVVQSIEDPGGAFSIKSYAADASDPPLDETHFWYDRCGLLTKEPFGLFEAMASGLPIAAFDNGASREIIDGETGRFVPWPQRGGHDACGGAILALRYRGTAVQSASH